MNNYPLDSYLTYKPDIDSAIQKVLLSGTYILGDEVRKFESTFSEYFNLKYAVGVGNGTDAIQIALRAAGIGKGDEVITVSHTAVATIAAIELVGAIPIFVDIDPTTYTLNPEYLNDVLSPKTKAVIPVHLYGHPADVITIRDFCQTHNLILIEDCAQAHGAKIKNQKVGTFGHFGVFSFYPTKNLGACGDAGLIMTNNTDYADRARALRQYGWYERNNSVIPGINSRLDEIQAAILNVKFRHLDKENLMRIRNAKIYSELLADHQIQVPLIKDDCHHVFHQYVIQTDKRDILKEFLRKNRIPTMVHYPYPVHMQRAYNGRIQVKNRLPITEGIAHHILSLPMHPWLPEEDIHYIVQKINSFFN